MGMAVVHRAVSAANNAPIPSQTRFVMALKSLQAKHLASTLKHLAPANGLPMWAAKVQV